MRQIVLHSWFEKTTGAVLENGKVVEWLFDSPLEGPQPGAIFQGKVIDIVPGMDAAFVDIGFEKNGFLYKKELIACQRDKVAPDLQENQSHHSIQSLLTKGQMILVQVKKEEVGSKGAKLTELLSFPGKFLVYLPEGGYVAASKKISSDEERQKWRERGHEWLTGNEGIIFRTLVEEVDAEDVFYELKRLRELYDSIVSKARQASKAVLSLYDDSSTIARIVRDFLNDDDSVIVVDRMSDYQQLKKQLPANKAWKVELYQGNENVFTHYHIDKQLEKSLKPFVWMKSGGSLKIDHTEAMTVIDVNSGKYIGKHGLRETALKINLEAAKTIAEQLRLRDIGGIILIDFIDMETDENRSQVLKMLKMSLSTDRTLTNVLGFTQLGLVEMTRKKTRKSLKEMLFTDCLICAGLGEIKKVDDVAQQFEEDLYSLRFSEEEAFLVELELRIYQFFSETGNSRMERLEEVTGKKIYTLPNLEIKGHEIRYIGNEEDVQQRWQKRRLG